MILSFKEVRFMVTHFLFVQSSCLLWLNRISGFLLLRCIFALLLLRCVVDILILWLLLVVIVSYENFDKVDGIFIFYLILIGFIFIAQNNFHNQRSLRIQYHFQLFRPLYVFMVHVQFSLCLL